jgi:hypothetical protein
MQVFICIEYWVYFVEALIQAYISLISPGSLSHRCSFYLRIVFLKDYLFLQTIIAFLANFNHGNHLFQGWLLLLCSHIFIQRMTRR